MRAPRLAHAQVIRSTPEDPVEQLSEYLRREAKMAERNAEATAFLRFSASSARLKELQEEEGFDDEWDD